MSELWHRIKKRSPISRTDTYGCWVWVARELRARREHRTSCRRCTHHVEINLEFWWIRESEWDRSAHKTHAQNGAKNEEKIRKEWTNKKKKYRHQRTAKWCWLMADILAVSTHLLIAVHAQAFSSKLEARRIRCHHMCHCHYICANQVTLHVTRHFQVKLSEQVNAHTRMSISYQLHSAWLRPSHSSRALLAFALCFRHIGDEATAAAMNDDHCKHTWLSAPDNKAKFTSPTETMLAAKLHISKSFFSARPTRK